MQLRGTCWKQMTGIAIKYRNTNFIVFISENSLTLTFDKLHCKMSFVVFTSKANGLEKSLNCGAGSLLSSNRVSNVSNCWRRLISTREYSFGNSIFTVGGGLKVGKCVTTVTLLAFNYTSHSRSFTSNACKLSNVLKNNFISSLQHQVERVEMICEVNQESRITKPARIRQLNNRLLFTSARYNSSPYSLSVISRNTTFGPYEIYRRTITIHCTDLQHKDFWWIRQSFLIIDGQSSVATDDTL